MKLIVNRGIMLSNVERAKQMCSSPIALMFKDFYEDMYDSRFSDYTCFSNSLSKEFDVTSNIGNTLQSKGKVITSIEELLVYRDSIKRLYVPINHLDNREGVDVVTAQKIFAEFNDKRNSYLMITSGCLNDSAPTDDEIANYYRMFSHLVKGLSVGGSYYLQRNIPKYVEEIRLGEYMLFGTIPYCNKRELFGDNALIFQTNVIGVYPERKQVLVDGGTATINTKDCILLSGGLQYDNSSCDYTIYNDPFGRYQVGDVIEMIPDYNSLKLMRNVAREYKK